MFNVVLCDDNSSSLDSLSSALTKIFIKNDIDAHVEKVFTDPNKLLEYANNNSIDVLFLDIDLKSNINGIETAKKYRTKNKSTYIIFITAHLEYMMLAYKVKTFDYLLKPFTTSKLEETVLRLYDDMMGGPNSPYLKFGNGKYLIRQSDIEYIEKNRAKAIIHTTYSDIEVYVSFNDLKSCLPVNFMRCHKSYIVNCDKITEVDTKHNTLYLNSREITYSDKFFDVKERMNFFSNESFN